MSAAENATRAIAACDVQRQALLEAALAVPGATEASASKFVGDAVTGLRNTILETLLEIQGNPAIFGPVVPGGDTSLQ